MLVNKREFSPTMKKEPHVHTKLELHVFGVTKIFATYTPMQNAINDDDSDNKIKIKIMK